MKLKDISAIMKHIDICMLATYGPRGVLEARPMSNNRQVDYDGKSYFFTMNDKAVVAEIKKDNNVNLSLIGHHSFINRTSIYISIIGKAKLVTDNSVMKKHWVKDLELWFKKGLNTPGLTLIQVKAKSVRYWDGMKEGVIKL